MEKSYGVFVCATPFAWRQYHQAGVFLMRERGNIMDPRKQSKPIPHTIYIR